MLKREKIEPPRNEECIVNTKSQIGLLARWLSGNKIFEGWYLPDIGMILPQKELGVKEFKGLNDKAYKTYIPKSVLDRIFSERDEIPLTYYNQLSSVYSAMNEGGTIC